MRHLLGGAAIAALLAAGLPAAAQNNSTPASPPSAGTDQNQSGTSANQMGTHHKHHAAKHKTMHTAARHASRGDNIAEQLNRQELERVQQNGAQPQGSGSSMTPENGGAMRQPSNGTASPNAGANSMPGTVTSGATGHSTRAPQQ